MHMYSNVFQERVLAVFSVQFTDISGKRELPNFREKRNKICNCTKVIKNPDFFRVFPKYP